MRREARSGNLLITPAVSPTARDAAPTFTELAPIAWQRDEEAWIAVKIQYAVARDGSVSFDLGEYEPTRLLIIDPTLNTTRYVGQQGNGGGEAIAVDAVGNRYLLGRTAAIGQAINLIVIKLNPAGTIRYQTTLGGTAAEYGRSLAVDADQSVYLTGETRSADFPLRHALQGTRNGASDSFVTRLDPQGVLHYSTYLGGSERDHGRAIVVGSAEQVYVMGGTTSDDFPTTSNASQSKRAGPQDAFVAHPVLPSGPHSSWPAQFNETPRLACVPTATNNKQNR